MTRIEFIENTDRKRFFKKAFEYLLSLSPIGVGLFFIYEANFTDWLEIIDSDKAMTKEQISISMLFFIFFGLYGIKTVRHNYKLISIESGLPLEEKKKLIRQLAQNIKATIIKPETIPFILFKPGGIFGYSKEIRIFIDKEGFLLDLKALNVGVIDFGYRNRLIKRIKKEMLPVNRTVGNKL